MEATLLQYGALGVLVMAAMGVSTVLWRQNLAQQKTILEMMKRYEDIVKALVEQQTRLEGTLEHLQEGMAAKDLLAQYVEKLGRERS